MPRKIRILVLKIEDSPKWNLFNSASCVNKILCDLFPFNGHPRCVKFRNFVKNLGEFYQICIYICKIWIWTWILNFLNEIWVFEYIEFRFLRNLWIRLLIFRFQPYLEITWVRTKIFLDIFLLKLQCLGANQKKIPMSRRKTNF